MNISSLLYFILLFSISRIIRAQNYSVNAGNDQIEVMNNYTGNLSAEIANLIRWSSDGKSSVLLLA